MESVAKAAGTAAGGLERALAEALEQEAAAGEILRLISQSPADAQPVFEAVVRAALRLCEASTANVVTFDGELIHVAAFASISSAGAEALHRHFANYPRSPSRDAANARAILTRSVVMIPDVLEDRDYRVGATAVAAGYRSILSIPLMCDGAPIGAITVARPDVGPFPARQTALLATFAEQAVIALRNVRLFRELELRSRELESASKHKSEFLANMSHELRTPLNAILGFSEVLSARLFGELNDKQAEYVGDIQESGRHLLALINDILDLSKIEAGRMELDLGEFDLPETVEGTLVLVREKALRRGIALECTVDPRLGRVRADQRKIKQVLLNLLSNALKFTPERGRVDVQAVLRDGMAEISVADTGIGIAPEDLEAVFEEFRQVGTVSKAVEGTGLGLAISRKFVELHGGTIRVSSQVGRGATFAFTLPLQ